jgi:hypothetical protein
MAAHWEKIIDEEFHNISAEQKKRMLCIAKEVESVDIKPYSHSIISLQLSMLAENGMDEKDIRKTITTFGLDEKGWEYLLEESPDEVEHQVDKWIDYLCEIDMGK